MNTPSPESTLHLATGLTSSCDLAHWASKALAALGLYAIKSPSIPRGKACLLLGVNLFDWTQQSIGGNAQAWSLWILGRLPGYG